jgi:hypothetical protein
MLVIPRAETMDGASGRPWNSGLRTGAAPTMQDRFRFRPRCAHPPLPCQRTDLGVVCALPLPVGLKEDKRPNHDVLAASGIGRRGRVDTRSMERPARDGAVGHRVVALEH